MCHAHDPVHNHQAPADRGLLCPNTVKVILPESLRNTWAYDSSKPIGKQLGGKWKKYNRRMARAIDWSDVEKHEDLTEKISKKVEDYANTLKS